MKIFIHNTKEELGKEAAKERCSADQKGDQ